MVASSSGRRILVVGHGVSMLHAIMGLGDDLQEIVAPLIDRSRPRDVDFPRLERLDLATIPEWEPPPPELAAFLHHRATCKVPRKPCAVPDPLEGPAGNRTVARPPGRIALVQASLRSLRWPRET